MGLLLNSPSCPVPSRVGGRDAFLQPRYLPLLGHPRALKNVSLIWIPAHGDLQDGIFSKNTALLC